MIVVAVVVAAVAYIYASFDVCEEGFVARGLDCFRTFEPETILAQCTMTTTTNSMQPISTFPNDTEFVVYTNISHHHHDQYHGMLRIGIPGTVGYRCQYESNEDGSAMIIYQFKHGSIKLKDEFYACVDNLDTGRLNCDIHRYVNQKGKNPELVNISLKPNEG